MHSAFNTETETKHIYIQHTLMRLLSCFHIQQHPMHEESLLI